MADLVLTDLEEGVLRQLQQCATSHGRTVADEAKAILSATLHKKNSAAWTSVDAIYDRLAASGRAFSDSAELLREDRGR